MEFIRNYFSFCLLCGIALSFLEPNETIQRYVRLIINLCLILVAAQPVRQFVQNPGSILPEVTESTVSADADAAGLIAEKTGKNIETEIAAALCTKFSLDSDKLLVTVSVCADGQNTYAVESVGIVLKDRSYGILQNKIKAWVEDSLLCRCEITDGKG